jgi:ADP-L-glycero-D-manno-heptose 6-epimerase
MIYGNKDFNTKTILVTGGAGFIGSSIVFYIQENFPRARIVVFDCLRSESTFKNGNLKSFGHYQNLIGFKGDLICGDISNNQDLKLLDAYNFDYIFHQAAISDTTVFDQELVLRINVNSFYKILKITKKHKSTLIYASSASTYGFLPSPQTVGKEDPSTPYGFSKLMMDNLANQFSSKNPDITVIGLRFFNVFGPREFYKSKTASMVIQLGHQILNGNPPKLFNNSDQIFRDFIYIEDVVQANIKACSAKTNGTYNVGTGVSRSFQDIADILQKILKTDYGTEYFKNPHTQYQTDTRADIDDTKTQLDFLPNYSLEKGIETYLPEIKLLHNQPLL